METILLASRIHSLDSNRDKNISHTQYYLVPSLFFLLFYLLVERRRCSDNMGAVLQHQKYKVTPLQALLVGAFCGVLSCLFSVPR